jgi:hypothetical protein
LISASSWLRLKKEATSPLRPARVMAISEASSLATPIPFAMAIYVLAVFLAARVLIPNCVIAVLANSSAL